MSFVLLRPTLSEYSLLTFPNHPMSKQCGNGGSSQSWSSAGWQCKVCQQWNWPKHKTCWTCKAMRSYADVAKNVVPPPKVLTPGQALQQQLTEITRQLSQAVAGPPTAVQGGASPYPPSPGTEPTETPDRQQLAQLEASLAQLPDMPCFATSRAALIKQITEVKSRVDHTKPIGSRIDSCKAALERARQRLATADAALTAAQSAKEVATQQVSTLEHDLRELQAVVAANAAKQSSSNCLDRLQTEMETVIQEMSTSGAVDGADIASSMQQMVVLFQNLTQIASKSAAVPQPVAMEGIGPAAAAAPPAPINHDPDRLTDASVVPGARDRLQTLMMANAASHATPLDCPTAPPASTGAAGGA